MITMREIADACDVSIMTVSRSLNNSRLVSKNTKKKVLEACKTLGYIPNSVAKTLVTRKTNMIGLVVPDIDYFYADIIKSITLALENRNYGVLLCDYNHDKKKEIEYLYYLLQGRVDGIILFPINPTKQDYEGFIDRLPIVFANKFATGLNVSFVGSDNYSGTVQLIEYMIAKEYKRIGVIYSDLSHKSFNDRMRGYKNTLNKHGIAFDDKIICESRLLFKEGYHFSEQLIAKGVDSIFAFNDVCAMGIVRYCSDNGIKVPGDIGVAGYDNITYLELFNHKLTTVDFKGVMLGSKLADLILNEISNPQLLKRTIILSPELVFGETV